MMLKFELKLFVYVRYIFDKPLDPSFMCSASNILAITLGLWKVIGTAKAGGMYILSFT